MAEGEHVYNILSQAAIAANRPIDHMRRIGTSIFIGSIGGVILGLMVMNSPLTLRTPIYMVLLLVVYGGVFLLPWIKKDAHEKTIPVVAKVIGTRETEESRLVKRGKKITGILVPVVCRPAEDNVYSDVDFFENDESFFSRVSIQKCAKKEKKDFSAVIAIESDDGGIPLVPEPDTLLYLEQRECGMGDVQNLSGNPTGAQVELMKNLEKNPKLLKKKLRPLPVRRGVMERAPWWAALEFWGCALVGAFTSAIALSLMNA